jgi:hypothetical protein
VYNRNLKIYRGADARIDIQVKNCYQKPISISGSHQVFNLVTKETQRVITRKDFVLVPDGTSNAEKGRAHVTLSKEEMQGLEEGYYQYSVITEQRQYTGDIYKVTASRPMYVDSQFGAFAVLEIFGDVSGEPQASLEITQYSYIYPFATGDSDPAYNIFSLIDANPHTNTALSSHTFQFYHSTDYTGNIRIQGSLDETADPFNWIDIPDSYIEPGINNFTTDNETSTYKTVTGKWKWFRVITGASFNGSARFVIGQGMNGNYSVSVYNGGKNYVAGQQLIISGDKLGGNSGVNDLTITVETVGFQGAITAVSGAGVSVANTRTFVLGATGEPSTGSVDKILYR